MMTVPKALTIVLIGCCSGYALSQETYPAWAPIENEEIIPPRWPASTPSHTYDDADPGGYIYTFAEKLKMFGGTLTSDDLPYCPCSNGFFMYLYVVIIEMQPMDDPLDWNCTRLGYIFKHSDFTGMVAGTRVCNVGECCDGIIGHEKYSDDVSDYEAWFNDRVIGSSCEIPMEDMYCVYVGGDFSTNCQEYTPELLWRFYTIPCYDNQYLFNINCKVFTVEYPVAYKKEPPMYYASISNDVLISNDAYQNLQDRVCRPNSYFNPSTSSTSSSSSSSSPTPDDSSFGAIWTPMLVVVSASLFL